MTQKTTYFAIVDDLSSRQEPAGVLRRIEDADGESDEVFTRELVWKRSSSLYSAERGNLDNKFIQITKDEAEQIIERIRAAVRGGTNL
jgi:hypothetical protein